MKALILSLGLCLAVIALAGCSPDATQSATVSFNLTDAPVDSQNVQSVFVKFGSLKINESGTAAETDSTWIDVPIDATKEYDLLSLSSGVTALLGNVSLTAGTQVNQIRFLNPTIEVVEVSAPATRLPCALASSTGLKIVNAFQVPLTGSLTLTVDFDVRKSLVYTGGGYKIKPVLRAVVEGEAGNIAGALASGYVIYAYKTGSYAASEATADPVTGVVFGNSVTSAKPFLDATTSTYRYRLAFLEAGTYDLIVVNLTSASVNSSTYLGEVVASGKTTALDISVLP
jgi:hypothetical protein